MQEGIYPGGLSDEADRYDVIESRLAGALDGCAGKTEFRLLNGQVWRQRSPGYIYRYRYMPRVAIISTPSGRMMRIEGVPGAIPVERAG